MLAAVGRLSFQLQRQDDAAAAVAQAGIGRSFDDAMAHHPAPASKGSRACATVMPRSPAQTSPMRCPTVLFLLDSGGASSGATRRRW